MKIAPTIIAAKRNRSNNNSSTKKKKSSQNRKNDGLTSDSSRDSSPSSSTQSLQDDGSQETNLQALVAQFAKQLGKEKEIDRVLQILDDNWINDLAMFHQVSHHRAACPLAHFPEALYVLLKAHCKDVYHKDQSQCNGDEENEGANQSEKGSDPATCLDEEAKAPDGDAEKESAGSDDKPSRLLSSLLPASLTQMVTEEDEEKLQNEIVEVLRKYHEDDVDRYIITKVFVNALSNFSMQEGTVYIDVGVCMWWRQPSYIGVAEVDMETVWKPDLEIVGAGNDLVAVMPDGGSYDIREAYVPYGGIAWYQRYKGTIRQDVNLSEFPFDTQDLKILIGSTLYSSEDVKLVNMTSPKLVSVFAKEVDKLHEWHLANPVTVNEMEIFNLEDGRPISYIDITFPLRRHVKFYLSNVFAIIFFLNILSWGIYLLPSDAYNDRLNIIITLFLAMIAFSFVLSDTLPKVQYSTPLSTYISVNYLCLAILCILMGASFTIQWNAFYFNATSAQDIFTNIRYVEYGVLGVIMIFQISHFCYIYFIKSRQHDRRTIHDL